MAVAAHPDDIESWCAGASADPAAVAAQGEAEAQEAARRFGLTEVVFLLQPDGDVEDTRALRGELVLWIRRGRPAVLFTHDPEKPDSPYLAHHRHRIVGRVALDAVYPFAGDPLSFPEQVRAGLAPHAVTNIWLFASEPAAAYVFITAGFERKLAARLAHESQSPDPTALPESWRALAAQIGTTIGVPLAEASTKLRLDCRGRAH